MCLDDGWERERHSDMSRCTTLARLLIEFCWWGTEEVSASVGEMTLEGLICLLKASQSLSYFSPANLRQTQEIPSRNSIRTAGLVVNGWPCGVDFVCGAGCCSVELLKANL